MSGNVRVVEDGAETAVRRTGAPAPWLLVAVSFVVGLGLGVLVVGPTPQPSATDPAADLRDPVEETVTTQPGDGGVVSVIPGFPDAVVAVARTGGSTLDHMLWPHRGPLTIQSMANGMDVRFDVSSQWIALSGEVPGLGGRLLSMGRFNSIQTVATGVTSSAWHDSKSGTLAYTAAVDGALGLFVIQPNFNPTLVVSGLPEGQRVVAWGEWGWALQTETPEVVLLTPDGAFRDTDPGVAYTSHPSGWIFAIDGGRPKLVSNGGGVRSLDTEVSVGSVRAAAFSRDGEKVAVGGSRGLEVVELASGETVRLASEATSWVSWSSDGAFVLGSAGSGMAVFELETLERYRLLSNYPVVAAAVIPLRAS